MQISTIKYSLLSIVLYSLTMNAHASNIKFTTNFKGGFISGQFTCTEINQYGSLNYACGHNTGDGSIRGIPAGKIITLPDNYFNPYHNPKKLIIKSVSITNFAGEIQQYGETIFTCSFPAEQITKNTNACIILTKDGQCQIKPSCSQQ